MSMMCAGPRPLVLILLPDKRGQMRGIRKALNDALCLQGLNELSTMTVPLQSPSTWRPGPWTAELTTDVSRSILVNIKLFSRHSDELSDRLLRAFIQTLCMLSNSPRFNHR